MTDVQVDGLSKAEHELVDETLRFVVERSWRVSNTDFFRDLVTHLGQSLSVAYAFCDRIDAADTALVHTLALYAKGEVSENISYGLVGTPCENVVGRTTCCYVDGVQQKFPYDQLLVELGAESYAGVPLWTGDGKPLGLIAVMDDKPLQSPELAKVLLQILATRAGSELERMQDLDKLKQSEQRFADFADVSSDWFWETDADLRFSFFSHQYEPVTGTDPELLLGRTRRQVGAPGADPEAFQKLLETLENHQPFRDFQHHRVLPDGNFKYLAISAKPAFDKDHKFIGYRGAGRDVTAQKVAEMQLIASRDAATKANNAKSEFLANMSHELRTPLNSIIGYSEILESELFGALGSDKNREYASIVLASGNHLHEIIGDILDLSKIEAGEESLSEEPVEVRKLIEECLEMMRDSARKKRVDLTLDMPSQVPLFVADRLKLKQILLNLLSNGLKFTPAGGDVLVDVALTKSRALKIAVRDTGVGIAPEEIDNVLQPFVQVGDAYTRSHDGTGLGLALVKSLVELHGGSVQITSQLNKGTAAVILFPAARIVD